MVGLLDIPLELREPILLDVILDTTQQKPNDPESAHRSATYKSMKTHLDDEPGVIFFKPLRRHAMPLLHVNQQIRDEVVDIMPRRLGQRIDDVKVDVIFVDEEYWSRHRDLCATWLSAPFPTKRLHTVHTQVRHFQMPSHPDFRMPQPPPSKDRDCRNWVDPESAVMLLYFVVESLVAEGGENSMYEPQTIAGAAVNRNADCTIQNLVIDIPFNADQQDSPETRVRCTRCEDIDGNNSSSHKHRMIPSGKRAALLFAQSLYTQMLRIFDAVPKYWRENTFPYFIFERIGTIDLKVDGRLFRHFDLSQILADLPRNEQVWTEGGLSRAKFFKWKRAAEKKRKTAGFKVVKPSIQEDELAGSEGLIASILAARDGTLVQKVPTLTDDAMPSTSQPAGDEVVAFTGDAVFVQEDGVKLPGHATFFSSDIIWIYSTRLFSRRETSLDILPNVALRNLESMEPREYEESVLFEGETILFQSDKYTSNITSGNATFYGRAENGSTE